MSNEHDEYNDVMNRFSDNFWIAITCLTLPLAIAFMALWVMG